jgi:hypothetical protein
MRPDGSGHVAGHISGRVSEQHFMYFAEDGVFIGHILAIYQRLSRAACVFY